MMMLPFGKPGLPPNWSPASKQGIGTACNDQSKVWFTLANGIVTEIFYPTIDTANIRDLQFLITDGKSFFDEERKDTISSIEYINPKALAYRVINTAKNGRYRLIKDILTDPDAQPLVIKTSFQALEGRIEDIHLYILLAPHIKNQGYGNYGRCARYNQRDYLIAWREDISLALTADVPFRKMSCGYSGFSDGYQDLKDNLKMDWSFERVEDGNIALVAEIAPVDDFMILLSFGRDDVEAVLEANKTLEKRHKAIEKEYIKSWHGYLSRIEDLSKQSLDGGRLYWISAMVLIRDPSDPHVLKTLPVVDRLLKVDTPSGPAWHRYNNDGYGEKADGSPFDGSGIGRVWPLLTGERGMYEFLAGRSIDPYIKTMEGFGNEGGLIPEQVWDSEDIPEKGLFKGKGTGAATPLVWAQAEYIKLLRTKRDCKGCDIIPEVYERYVTGKKRFSITAWKKNKPIKRIKASDTLRIISFEPAILHWSLDDWKSTKDSELLPSGLGLFYHDIPAGTFKQGDIFLFTFYYPSKDRWEGKDYSISLV